MFSDFGSNPILVVCLRGKTGIALNIASSTQLQL